ncbi:hypothetical protein [Effusibacillus lacus]|uniref:DNA-binding protein n=1 Tax=Effusibacillus lacus TaxID=1348429 RepID=A0A292YL78_9BACL|nr:hypothetical protein [Effusibacillus lacus]TCS71396.1 hypothetical protein EDD64_12614 [Effusibacillus lacus]GAX89926.1 DNA-binding protein [Effusibacillus lacus]
MEFVTIHELARLSGVSTATIRLDIKAGRLPIAAPGKRGRGNPTRIRIKDLENSDRLQYQQLARRVTQDGTLGLMTNERDTGKFSVSELALRTGLSPQVVRKDIIDGKLRAEGGGRRGSPYFILLENLADAGRMEYRRLVESQRLPDDQALESLRSEISQIRKEIQSIKEKLHVIEAGSGILQSDIASGLHQQNDVPPQDIVRVPVESVILPAVFAGYYVSDEKLKQLKNRIRNGEQPDPILVRRMENGKYLLRKGIAQYHVAQEMGLNTLPACLESSEE